MVSVAEDGGYGAKPDGVRRDGERAEAARGRSTEGGAGEIHGWTARAWLSPYVQRGAFARALAATRA